MSRTAPTSDIPEETLTAEAIAEATAEEPGPAQPSDADILKAIQAEMAARQPAERRISVADLYSQFVALTAASLGYRTERLKSETNAVKLMELALMWALNNRGGAPSHDIIPAEDLVGGGDEAGDEGPEPDEVIEAAADQTDPDPITPEE